jgi:diacylglycerol kinase (ATP)
MEKFIYTILNPVAGNSDPDAIEQLVAETFNRPGEASYEIYQTTGKDDMRSVVGQAVEAGYQRIVAAGGDGTVSAVADALAGTRVPMGILPVGTGNLLARDLQIPLELSEAAALLADPDATSHSIDAMQVNGRTYISHISLGVYSQIIRQTTPEQKRRFGRMAYIWAALKEISRYPTWRFELEVDGRLNLYRASMIVIANVSSVGIPPLQWGPDISPDDGQIDICIIKARTAAAYFQLLWRALQNQHDLDRRHIEYLPAGKGIELRTNRDVPIRADGEIIGKSAVSIQVVPDVLKIISPRHSPE